MLGGSSGSGQTEADRRASVEAQNERDLQSALRESRTGQPHAPEGSNVPEEEHEAKVKTFTFLQPPRLKELEEL